MAAGPKTVILIDRDGGEVAVSDPTSINNLVYGQGYRIKGNPPVEKAVAAVADNEQAELAAVPVTAESKAPRGEKPKA